MAHLDPSSGTGDRVAEGFTGQWRDLSDRYDRKPLPPEVLLPDFDPAEAQREDDRIAWQLDLGLVIDDRIKAYRPGFR